MRKIFFASVYSIVGWAKAPLRRAHHNKAQSLRREVGGHAIGRAFARPMALPTLRSTRLTSRPGHESVQAISLSAARGRHFARLLRPEIGPAVDMDRLTGDVACSRPAQKSHRGCDVFRLATCARDGA